MKHKMIKNLVASAVGLGLFSPSIMAEDITVWAWDPNFNVAIMKEAAVKYNAMNPDVNITILDFAKDDVEQKLHTVLASGVTSALPDIVLIEDYNAQKYLNSYPGSFAPMTEVVDYSKFAPYKVNVMTMDNDVYGLPFDTGVTGLYYRTDILEKAGFTAEDLQDITWNRFIEIGKQVKEKTGVYMFADDPSDLGLLRIMMQGAGSWYFNDDGSMNIANNPALIESIKNFTQLHSTGIGRPTVGWSEWVGSINSGIAATITTGVWITSTVKSGEGQEGKWAVAPTPRLNIEGAVNSSNLGGSSWYVLSASKSADTSIDFLNEILGKDTEFYNQILQDQGAVSAYLPAADTEAYQFADDFFNGQRIYSDFSQWAADIPPVNYGMYTYEVDAAISSQLPTIFNGGSIEEALKRVESQLSYQLR